MKVIFWDPYLWLQLFSKALSFLLVICSTCLIMLTVYKFSNMVSNLGSFELHCDKNLLKTDAEKNYLM